MTGTVENAALALAGENLYSADGTTRNVFLIDNVIYKVEFLTGTNAYEYSRYKHFKNKLPRGIGLPKMSLIRVGMEAVLAAEYIEGRVTGVCVDCILGDDCRYGDCLDIIFHDVIANMFGADASAYGNVIERDATLYVVDLGN